MNKRMRKKHYLKEFISYGFMLKASFSISPDGSDDWAVFEQVLDMLEPKDRPWLECGGGGNIQGDTLNVGFGVSTWRPTRAKYGRLRRHWSVTEEEKQFLIQRVLSIQGIKSLEVSDLMDMNTYEEPPYKKVFSA